MSNPFKTLGFKKLKKEWEKKLKESGFNCAEHGHKKKALHPNYHFTELSDKHEQTELYYELCRKLLHTATFKKPLHKQVWELHSEGLTIREIASKLDAHNTTIFRIISRYEELVKGPKK